MSMNSRNRRRRRETFFEVTLNGRTQKIPAKETYNEDDIRKLCAGFGISYEKFMEEYWEEVADGGW